MTRLCGYSFFIALILLTACGDEQVAKTAQPQPVVVKTTAPPVFTKDQWKTAFSASFETADSKPGEDGVTSYIACFGRSDDGKCARVARGHHDAFRKIDHLVPPRTAVNQALGDRSYVGVYIAAPECSSPSILITSHVTGSEWLFMESVALLVDGEVIIDRNFERGTVKRDHVAHRTWESAAVVAADKEREALKALAGSSNVLARISGGKGYLTIEKKHVAELISDVKLALEMIDRIDAALLKAGGPMCN